MLQKFTSLFPLWAIILSAIALLSPDIFLPIRCNSFSAGACDVGMGMTLALEDFLLVFKRPKAVFIGTILQYALMPFIGYAISRIFSLSSELTAGVVLLGCARWYCIKCYILSCEGRCSTFHCVDIVSTLISFVMTPLLTWAYIGQTIDVDMYGMLISILQIVIVPVALGIAIKTVLSSRIENIRHLFPVISVLTIVFIISIIMALNRDTVILRDF